MVKNHILVQWEVYEKISEQITQTGEGFIHTTKPKILTNLHNKKKKKNNTGA